MELPSTNQYYLVLKSLADQSTSTDLSGLLAGMRAHSEKRWGLADYGERYVLGPAPLNTVLREMIRNGDVLLGDNCSLIGTFILSSQGRQELVNTEVLLKH